MNTDGLTPCPRCDRPTPDDELYECALSMPAWPVVECYECVTECSPCRDEARKEWAAEHGPRSRG